MYTNIRIYIRLVLLRNLNIGRFSFEHVEKYLDVNMSYKNNM